MPCKYLISFFNFLGHLSFVKADPMAGNCRVQYAMQWRSGAEHFETFFLKMSSNLRDSFMNINHLLSILGSEAKDNTKRGPQTERRSCSNCLNPVTESGLEPAIFMSYLCCY